MGDKNEIAIELYREARGKLQKNIDRLQGTNRQARLRQNFYNAITMEDTNITGSKKLKEAILEKCQKKIKGDTLKVTENFGVKEQKLENLGDIEDPSKIFRYTSTNTTLAYSSIRTFLNRINNITFQDGEYDNYKEGLKNLVSLLKKQLSNNNQVEIKNIDNASWEEIQQALNSLLAIQEGKTQGALKLNGNGKDLKTSLNEVYTALQMVFVASAAGRVGEYSASYLNQAYQAYQKNQLSEIIEFTDAYVQGSTARSKKIVSRNEAIGRKYYPKGQSVVTKNNVKFWIGQSTLDKVDVILEIQDEKPLTGASAKNYTLPSAVKIFQGNLLSVLTGGGKFDKYVTAFLESIKVTYPDDKANENSRRKQEAVMLYKLMKEIAGCYGLIGPPIGYKDKEPFPLMQADYLIINNGKEKTPWEIYSTRSICNMILKDVDDLLKFSREFNYRRHINNSKEWFVIKKNNLIKLGKKRFSSVPIKKLERRPIEKELLNRHGIIKQEEKRFSNISIELKLASIRTRFS